MADTLIVQLIPPISRGDGDEPSAIDCAAHWLHLPDEASPDTAIPETGQLSQLLQQPPVDCQWIVLIPGEDVLTTTVKLPRKRRRQALKALPFMLEDSIASDVALEHLAVGPDDAQEQSLVAIIRKQQLRDLLHLFTDAGITPQRVLPDYAMLPVTPDAWQVLLSGDRALVRCPDGTGFSTSRAQLAHLLNTGQAQESDGSDRQIRIITPPGATGPVLLDHWHIEEQSVADPLQYLAANDASSESLNLLQGEFKLIQKEPWNWRPWAAAAVLAVLAVVIALLETGLETVQLNRETAQLQASMIELAREALPDTQQIRDPQTQLLIAWRQLNNGSMGDAEFLPLLNRVSATINQQAVTVLGIHFRDGTLTLALQGSSLQQLDNLRQQIEQQGLDASLLDASTDADSARSNLAIQAAGPQAPRSAG